MSELSRLSNARIAILFAAPLVILCVTYGTPLILKPVQPPKPSPAVNQLPPDGAKLYATHCANCHGMNGDGRGAAKLSPPARWFGRDEFKFGSTVKNAAGESVPTDDDLMGVIHRGISGSAMPAFDHLSNEQKQAIVNHVRNFIPAGLERRLIDSQIRKNIASAVEDGEDPLGAYGLVGGLAEGALPSEELKLKPAQREQFALQAAKRAEPGAPLMIPEPTDAADAAVSRGKLLYKEWGCSKCHGESGQGDGETVRDFGLLFRRYQASPFDTKIKADYDKQILNGGWIQTDGTLAKPRNFTLGLFKGGGDPKQLYARIVLGIPPVMPATEGKPPGQVYDLIHYIRSFGNK